MTRDSDIRPSMRVLTAVLLLVMAYCFVVEGLPIFQATEVFPVYFAWLLAKPVLSRAKPGSP